MLSHRAFTARLLSYVTSHLLEALGKPDSLPCTLLFHVNEGRARGARTSRDPAARTCSLILGVKTPIASVMQAQGKSGKDGDSQWS